MEIVLFTSVILFIWLSWAPVGAIIKCILCMAFSHRIWWFVGKGFDPHSWDGWRTEETWVHQHLLDSVLLSTATPGWVTQGHDTNLHSDIWRGQVFQECGSRIYQMGSQWEGWEKAQTHRYFLGNIWLTCKTKLLKF